MTKEDIEKIINLRSKLINNFESLKDYKSNKNALMKEIDHAQAIHSVIVKLDDILKNHVSFSDKN